MNASWEIGDLAMPLDARLGLDPMLDELMKATNMNCLTPEAGMKGECQFLSANLYAKSVFGKFRLRLPPNFTPE